MTTINKLQFLYKTSILQQFDRFENGIQTLNFIIGNDGKVIFDFISEEESWNVGFGMGLKGYYNTCNSLNYNNQKLLSDSSIIKYVGNVTTNFLQQTKLQQS